MSVIDGYEWMKGYGATRGTAVEHRVCVVGTDWLAADSAAVELMGIDFTRIGYLNELRPGGAGRRRPEEDRDRR